MSYEEHPIFKSPHNINQKIWRYFKLEFYVDLLKKQALYFARLDRLGDKFEGSITIPEMKLRRSMRKAWVDQFSSILPQLTYDKILAYDSKFWKHFRKHFAVNCWHMNEHESEPMWKRYDKDKKYVAVQSTYKKLKESFDDHKENAVWIGKVDYADFTKDTNPSSNAFYRFIRKEKSFEQERELRAVTYKITDGKGNILEKPFDKGIHVSVDLNLLIDKVVVSPYTDSLLKEVKLETKKYNLDKSVELSILTKNPLF